MRTSTSLRVALLLVSIALSALVVGVGERETHAQERSAYRYQGAPMRKIQTDRGPVLTLGRRHQGRAKVTGDNLEINANIVRRYEALEEMEIVGAVNIVTDSLTLDTDSLRVYERFDVGHAFGNVRVETLDGVLATGDRAIYDDAKDWLAIMGKARVIDAGVMVAGDSIIYDRRRQEMEAFGAVRVVDEAAETVVTGEHGRFQRATGIAWVDSLPELTSRQEGGDPIRVTSRWMRFDRTRAHSRAVGDVDFRQGGTKAYADTADFFGRDLLTLTGSPRVEREQRITSGERIDIQYVEQKLRFMEVVGNASLVDSTPDTLQYEFRSVPLANVLEGDTLQVFIDDGEIERTFVRGNAHSVYLPEDQSSTVSVNDVSGHTIDITFIDAQVDQVLVTQGVQGQYRFLERSAVTPDTMSVIDADSLGAVVAADSLGASADSLAAAGTLDFTANSNQVSYTGDRTLFKVKDGLIEVGGKAQIKYDTLTLSSETVHYDTATQEMLAEGKPLLVDGDSELVGDRMGYLFDHKTGAVGQGATRFDDGFYYGRHIRRPDKDTLLVTDGRYTTCDLADPHFHFEARKMKLRLGERVVARQVTFKVSNIPLMVFPFYFKALDSGRRSGILFPNVNLGISSREGRYIRNFGYYWATNEYTDFKFEMDYNERRDATFTIDNRYNVRYGVSGSAKFDFKRSFGETRRGNQWKLVARHTQPEILGWKGQANVQMSSSKLDNEPGSDSSVERIDTQLRSGGSLGRNFDNGARVSLSFSRTQLVNNEDEDPTTDNQLYTQSLPGLGLSFQPMTLLSPRSGSDGNFFANILRHTTFSQRYGAEWSRTKFEVSQDDDVSANANFSLRYAPRGRLGPFVYSNSVSFTERYAYTREQTDAGFSPLEPDDTSGGIPLPTPFELDTSSPEVVETSSENTLNLTVANTLSTDFYGIFDTNLGPITGIKHKISYSTSHDYSPKLGDEQQRSQRISFALGNEISLKLRDGEAARDEVGIDGEPAEAPRDRKIDQVMRWGVSTSVNPEAEPGFRWSDFRSTLNLKSPLPQVSDVQVNQTFDAYTFDLLSTSVSTSVRLGGTLDLGGNLLEREERRNAVIDRLPEASVDSTEVDPLDEEFESDERRFQRAEQERFAEGTDRNAIPWSLNSRLSLTRTLNESTGEVSTRSNISGGASIRLPGKWSFSYSAGFDAEAGEFTNQYWRLSRDLHNWVLEFNRGIADGEDFGFRLYLREIPDLEVTRGNRDTGGVFNRLNQ